MVSGVRCITVPVMMPMPTREYTGPLRVVDLPPEQAQPVKLEGVISPAARLRAYLGTLLKGGSCDEH